MKDLDPIEDSGSEFENWPNERVLWIRLIVSILLGLLAATGLWIGGVMLINRIME